MSGTRKVILGAVALLSLMSGVAPAFADNGDRGRGNDNRWESDDSYVEKSYAPKPTNQGNSNDRYDRNDNRTNVARIYDNDRSVLRRYAQEHYKKSCAPGLAKKYDECLHYGQPQKRYIVGYALPDHILYYPVPDDVVMHLRPVPKGYRYVRVDNDVLLMQTATRQILDAVVLLASAGK